MNQLISQTMNINKTSNSNQGQDIVTQKRIHSMAEKIVKQSDIFKYLDIPSLSFENNPDSYEMEQIELNEPIFLSEVFKEEWADHLITEVAHFWVLLWSQGIALYDFKLYKQRTGKVMLFDFEHFGFRQQIGHRETITFPYETNSSLKYFFHHPCFPPNFQERLLNLPENLRVDMSKILKKE